MPKRFTKKFREAHPSDSTLDIRSAGVTFPAMLKRALTLGHSPAADDAFMLASKFWLNWRRKVFAKEPNFGRVCGPIASLTSQGYERD